MGLFLRIVGTVAAALVAVTLAAWWLLRDPNHLQPQLATVIAATTGVPVAIDGDLAWRLFPSLALRAENISADHQGTHYQLGQLALDVDLRSVIANQDLEGWRVRTLTLSDLTLATRTDRTDIDELKISDFTFDQPAFFETRLTLHSAEREPLPVTAWGKVLYRPATAEVQLRDTRLQTHLASALCNVDATIGEPSHDDEAGQALIPVSLWRDHSWAGECHLDEFELAGKTFRNADVTFRNDAGNSTAKLMLPEFFDGTASAKIDVNAQRDPVAWRVARPCCTG